MMLEPTLIPALERALHDLRFGYVQLVVHEGRLIHIERVERIRLPARAAHSTSLRAASRTESRDAEHREAGGPAAEDAASDRQTGLTEPSGS